MPILDTLQKLANIVAATEKNLNIKQFNETAVNDYFRSYLFEVLIIDSDKGSSFTNFTAFAASQVSGASINFGGFRCTWVASTSTPSMITSVQNVDFLHTQIKQAGRTTPEQWQVVIRDDSEGKAFKYFNDWRNVVYPNIKTIRTPSRYKKTASIKLIHPTGSESKHRLYQLYGVWPFQIGSLALDYESENVATFPVTLSFDYFEVKGVGGK